MRPCTRTSGLLLELESASTISVSPGYTFLSEQLDGLQILGIGKEQDDLLHSCFLFSASEQSDIGLNDLAFLLQTNPFIGTGTIVY